MPILDWIVVIFAIPAIIGLVWWLGQWKKKDALNLAGQSLTIQAGFLY